MHHAGYYPGAKVMTMKVLFEKSTFRLLGAQIIGYDGVDKRIDVLATAIRAGMKATDLKDLELSYAPPFSSAKDPVNMAGFIIDNIAKGIVKQWHIDDAKNLPDGASTEAELIVEKNRNGKTGVVKLNFYPSRMLFEAAPPVDRQYAPGGEE